MEKVKDGKGRTLEIKPLSVTERFRLFRHIPNDLQSNFSWMTWALSACSVRAIDGVPVPVPASMEDIETAVAQLDDEGMEAAQQFLVDRHNEKAQAAKNS